MYWSLRPSYRTLDPSRPTSVTNYGRTNGYPRCRSLAFHTQRVSIHLQFYRQSLTKPNGRQKACQLIEFHLKTLPLLSLAADIRFLLILNSKESSGSKAVKVATWSQSNSVRSNGWRRSSWLLAVARSSWLMQSAKISTLSWILFFPVSSWREAMPSM